MRCGVDRYYIWTALKLRGSDSYALLGAVGSMLAILFYLVLYNRMMAYVEKRAYPARRIKKPKRKTLDHSMFIIDAQQTLSGCMNQKPGCAFSGAGFPDRLPGCRSKRQPGSVICATRRG